MNGARRLAVLGRRQLIVNGNMSAGTLGWLVSGGAAIAAVGGELEITRSGSGQAAYQILATKVGKLYRVSFDFHNGTTSGTFFVGTSLIGTQLLGSQSTNTATLARFVYTFTATTTTSFVSWALAAIGTTYIDNVSVK
jgi:hypothetical protein